MPAPANKLRPWWSYDIGLIHFVGMSTEHNYSAGSAQHQWLENDLMNVNRSVTPWIIFTGIDNAALFAFFAFLALLFRCIHRLALSCTSIVGVCLTSFLCLLAYTIPWDLSDVSLFSVPPTHSLTQATGRLTWTPTFAAAGACLMTPAGATARPTRTSR
jgi:apolipoprotein N-acyltransferase